MEEETTYDHSKNVVYEAVGISEDRHNDVKSLCYQFAEESKTISEIAEKLEKSLNKRELAFLASMFVMQTYQEAEVMEKLFKGIMGGKKKCEEK